MIGIIGQGFVGNAIYQKFKNYFDVYTYDLDESKRTSGETEAMSQNIVFVCFRVLEATATCSILAQLDASFF